MALPPEVRLRASSTRSGRGSARPRKTFGRYDFDGARDPAGGRGTPARKRMVPLSQVAIDDPGEIMRTESGRAWERKEGSGRIFANAHRRADILEWERSHSLISDPAYWAGRLAQAVFERYRGPGAGNQWREGDRVDAASAHEHAIIKLLEDRAAVKALVEKIRGRLGIIDANIVRRLLADRMSYTDVAALTGKRGDRGARYVALRFRDALETLADMFGTKGKDSRRAPDKHDALAARHARRRGRWPDALRDAVDAHKKLRAEEDSAEEEQGK
jgi:hypothetical protein